MKLDRVFHHDYDLTKIETPFRLFDKYFHAILHRSTVRTLPLSDSLSNFWSIWIMISHF